MNTIYNVIVRELSESNGTYRLVKDSERKKPTADSMERLERELTARLKTNEAMRYRSYINANK